MSVAVRAAVLVTAVIVVTAAAWFAFGGSDDPACSDPRALATLRDAVAKDGAFLSGWKLDSVVIGEIRTMEVGNPRHGRTCLAVAQQGLSLSGAQQYAYRSLGYTVQLNDDRADIHTTWGYR